MNLVQQQIADETDNEARAAHGRCAIAGRSLPIARNLTIEVMLRLLRLFWNRFYSGIEVYNAERSARDGTQPPAGLCSLPSQPRRLPAAVLCHLQENLAIPYIAAGDNLNIPFIGRILRGGGAFFIRRSFRDNPLYGAIMRAYVLQLVKLGCRWSTLSKVDAAAPEECSSPVSACSA